MRLTSALSIRHLIAKLHPPLPQTPRESQQLLSVLQSSFNRRLDDVHPPPRPTEDFHASHAIELSPDVGSPSASAANAHLQAILSHPSLGKKKTTSETLVSKAIALFDNAVVECRVDAALVGRCIDLYQAGLNSGLRATGSSLGSKIAAWFTASKGDERIQMLIDTSLMSKVVPVMYRDRMEATVWDWLRMLYEGDFKAASLQLQRDRQKSSLKIEDSFVALMVRESLRRGNLAAAVLEYTEACEYRLSRPDAASSSAGERKGAGQSTPLSTTGRLISSAVLLRRKGHKIPAPLYDRLLSHSIMQPVEPRTVFWSFLPLYHPTAPHCRALYDSLRNPEYVNSLVWRIKGMRSDVPRTSLLTCILDGAELMLMQGSQEKARFLLDFAEDNFPAMSPSVKLADTGSRIQQAREEMGLQKSFDTGLVLT